MAISRGSVFQQSARRKQLELLHEVVPKAAAIALLLNPDNANAALELNDAEAAARALGLQLNVVRASNEREIDAAFAGLGQQPAAALFVASDAYLNTRRGQIVALPHDMQSPRPSLIVTMLRPAV